MENCRAELCVSVSMANCNASFQRINEIACLLSGCLLVDILVSFGVRDFCCSPFSIEIGRELMSRLVDLFDIFHVCVCRWTTFFLFWFGSLNAQNISELWFERVPFAMFKI